MAVNHIDTSIPSFCCSVDLSRFQVIATIPARVSRTKNRKLFENKREQRNQDKCHSKTFLALGTFFFIFAHTQLTQILRPKLVDLQEIENGNHRRHQQ